MATSPSDALRKKLLKRAKTEMIITGQIAGRLSGNHGVTPSEQKSRNMIKKLGSRDGRKFDADTVKVLVNDCRNCPKENSCNSNLAECGVKFAVHRCKQCGVFVRYRWIDGNPWMMCPSCKASKTG